MATKRVLIHSPMGWRRLPAGMYLVGRGHDCDIVVASNRASRKHARIVVTDSGATVEDLSSANGTHVNGKRIDGLRQLVNDDFIVVGETGLELTIEDDAGPTRVAALKPKSQPPSAVPDSYGGTDATLGSREGDRPEKWIEAWAQGLLEKARGGQLPDADTGRSAMRFGVELAVNRSPGFVDFVVELAALGVPLSLERARALTPVVEAYGVRATVVDAYLAKLGSFPADAERDALFALVQRWRARAR